MRGTFQDSSYAQDLRIPYTISYRILSCAPVKRPQFDLFWPFLRASREGLGGFTNNVCPVPS